MTSIEWTKPPGYRGESWNTTVGCSRVSEGCRNCYAEKMAARLREMGLPDYQGLTTGNGKSARWTGLVRELPDRLAKPLTRKAPTCWFVDSMSDLFHEDVSDEFIAAVFGVMAACPQHRFIILTKRAERLPRWFAWLAGALFERWGHADTSEAAEFCAHEASKHGADVGVPVGAPWPLANVVLGVSVEDQATADERIPYLLQTPAACRMVSYEPALEAVDFGAPLGTVGDDGACVLRDAFGDPRPLWACRACGGTRYREVDPVAIHCAACRGTGVGIGFVVVGGESGPGAREFDTDWARDTVHACDSAGVPVFVKQLGARPVAAVGRAGGPHVTLPLALRSTKGNDPGEWDLDLRVRQWPAMLMDRAETPKEVT